MRIYHRKTKQYEDAVEYQQELLQFLYGTVLGRVILRLVVARPWFSRLRARYYHSTSSYHEIEPFIRKFHVDMQPYNGQVFHTFNQFFTRTRSYQNSTSDEEFVAVADSKLSVYQIQEGLNIQIKNSIYDIEDILGQKDIPMEIRGGTCLVYRLSVDDYHRYVYPDDGVIDNHYKIKGVLHTVRSISDKYKVYSRNCRQVTVLDTKHFGKLIQIEVGALLVGHIVNHRTEGSFQKMEEKGYFEYGGSTIVQLIPASIKLDEDILEQAKAGVEVKVTIGERIGERMKC